MPKGENVGHGVGIDVKGGQYAQYWT